MSLSKKSKKKEKKYSKENELYNIEKKIINNEKNIMNKIYNSSENIMYSRENDINEIDNINNINFINESLYNYGMKSNLSSLKESNLNIEYNQNDSISLEIENNYNNNHKKINDLNKKLTENEEKNNFKLKIMNKKNPEINVLKNKKYEDDNFILNKLFNYNKKINKTNLSNNNSKGILINNKDNIKLNKYPIQNKPKLISIKNINKLNEKIENENINNNKLKIDFNKEIKENFTFSKIILIISLIFF
jgi:hypothetical protein